MKRYKNGRYKSKRTADLEDKIRLYTTMTLLTMALIFGFALQPWTVSVENPYHRTQQVHAQENTQEQIPEVQEEPTIVTDVETAIQALNKALGREVTDETKKRVQYLYDKSQENNVPFFDAFKTIYCESGWVNQKSHLPEESYGLSQIHVPSHKGVTIEQAMDAYFSIYFLVSHWYTPQAVNDKMWYGFSRATGNCTNGMKIEL